MAVTNRANATRASRVFVLERPKSSVSAYRAIFLSSNDMKQNTRPAGGWPRGPCYALGSEDYLAFFVIS
jgi:hypothetical protein